MIKVGPRQIDKRSSERACVPMASSSIKASARRMHISAASNIRALLNARQRVFWLVCWLLFLEGGFRQRASRHHRAWGKFFRADLLEETLRVRLVNFFPDRH